MPVINNKVEKKKKKEERREETGIGVGKKSLQGIIIYWPKDSTRTLQIVSNFFKIAVCVKHGSLHVNCTISPYQLSIFTVPLE